MDARGNELIDMSILRVVQTIVGVLLVVVIFAWITEADFWGSEGADNEIVPETIPQQAPQTVPTAEPIPYDANENRPATSTPVPQPTPTATTRPNSNASDNEQVPALW